MIGVDTRIIRMIVAAIVVLAAIVGVSLAAAAFAPTTVATTAEIDAQRMATERAIQRVYAAGIDQLKTTRSLKLAITDAQAAAVEQQYSDQLKAFRRGAFEAVAAAYGQSSEQSAQYVAQAESRLEAAAAASSPPVLLAPGLHAIVERMGQLTSQLTEQGIKEMTQSSPAPTPSPSPSPSSTPRPQTSPSPSPTSR